MIDIISTLLTKKITLIAKALMTPDRHKIIDYIKQKTGIDLTIENLNSNNIKKLQELENQNQNELKNLYYDLIKKELNDTESIDQHTTNLIKTINDTIVQQIVSEDKFVRRARPFVLYVSGICLGLLLISMSTCLLISPFIQNTASMQLVINAISKAMDNPSLWWFIITVNGISSLTRGIEKTKRLNVLTHLKNIIK